MRTKIAVCLLLICNIFSCRHNLHLSNASLSSSGICQSAIKQDGCEFYTCLEDQFSCGEHSYPIGFGKKYCQKFQNLCNGKLTSPKSKKWVLGTTQCLQDALMLGVNPHSTCDEISSTAFKSHSHCYTTGSALIAGVSFCALNPFEWNEIRGCVDIGDRLSNLGLLQIAETARKCSIFFLDGLLLNQNNSNETIDSDTDNLLKSLSQKDREQRGKEFIDFANSIENSISTK